MDNVDFLHMISDELEQLSEGLVMLDESYIDDEALLSLNEEELFELREELNLSEEELDEILESTRRTVNSQGMVRKVKSRQMRSRRAVSTTGMSKTELKRRAKKAARTRKRNPSGLRKAMKKRNKAMRKRRMMNIK